MTTERINISMPADVKEQAQSLADRLSNGKLSHLFSDFVSKKYAQMEERDRLAALLEEGYNSPVIEMSAEEYFNKARARIQTKIK